MATKNDLAAVEQNKILAEEAKANPVSVILIEGQSFPERGFWGITVNYLDHTDKTRKAITLSVDDTDLSKLIDIGTQGLKWWGDEVAQAESHKLVEPALQEYKRKHKMS